MLKDVTEVERLSGPNARLWQALRDGRESAMEAAVAALRAATQPEDADAHFEADRMERLGFDHLAYTPNLLWCLPEVWQSLVERLYRLCTAVSKGKALQSKGKLKAQAMLGAFTLLVTKPASESMQVYHLTYAAILNLWLEEVLLIVLAVSTNNKNNNITLQLQVLLLLLLPLLVLLLRLIPMFVLSGQFD